MVRYLGELLPTLFLPPPNLLATWLKADITLRQLAQSPADDASLLPATDGPDDLEAL